MKKFNWTKRSRLFIRDKKIKNNLESGEKYEII